MTYEIKIQFAPVCTHCGSAMSTHGYQTPDGSDPHHYQPTVEHRIFVRPCECLVNDRIAELEGREITEEQITRAFIKWHGSDLRPCPLRSAFEAGYRAALREDE